MESWKSRWIILARRRSSLPLLCAAQAGAVNLAYDLWPSRLKIRRLVEAEVIDQTVAGVDDGDCLVSILKPFVIDAESVAVKCCLRSIYRGHILPRKRRRRARFGASGTSAVEFILD